MPEQQEEEAEDDPTLQSMEQREAPQIREIAKEEEVTTRDEEDGKRDPTDKTKSLQIRKKLMRKNTEKLQRTK